AGTFVRKRDAERASRKAEAETFEGRYADLAATGRQHFHGYVTEAWLPNHVMEINTRQGYEHIGNGHSAISQRSSAESGSPHFGFIGRGSGKVGGGKGFRDFFEDRCDRVFCWGEPAFGEAREQNPADGGVSLDRDNGDVVPQVGQCESRRDGHAEADADH